MTQGAEDRARPHANAPWLRVLRGTGPSEQGPLRAVTPAVPGSGPSPTPPLHRGHASARLPLSPGLEVLQMRPRGPAGPTPLTPAPQTGFLSPTPAAPADQGTQRTRLSSWSRGWFLRPERQGFWEKQQDSEMMASPGRGDPRALSPAFAASAHVHAVITKTGSSAGDSGGGPSHRGTRPHWDTVVTGGSHLRVSASHLGLGWAPYAGSTVHTARSRVPTALPASVSARWQVRELHGQL